jgi:DNA modification methylase
MYELYLLDMYTPAIGHHVYRIDAWDKTTNITSGSFNMMYISHASIRYTWCPIAGVYISSVAFIELQ